MQLRLRQPSHKQSKDLYVIYFFAFLKKKHGGEESLLWCVQYHHQHQKSVRQTTQNNVSIFFSMGSIEELINASIDISENMMQYFIYIAFS